jgi:hypothetical protein
VRHTTGKPLIFWRTSGEPLIFWRTSGDPLIFWRTIGDPLIFWRTIGEPMIFWHTIGEPLIFLWFKVAGLPAVRAVGLVLTHEHLDVVLHAAGLTLILRAGLKDDGGGRIRGDRESERECVRPQLLDQPLLVKQHVWVQQELIKQSRLYPPPDKKLRKSTHNRF